MDAINVRMASAAIIWLVAGFVLGALMLDYDMNPHSCGNKTPVPL